LGLLRQARHRRKATKTRPIFTEYQYAEISEWLYEATGANEYRSIALEWARLCQKNQPWHAWPYAMEAKLSDDSPARRRAIAMAHYLDPLSERLSTVPKPTIEAAVKDLGRTNPFRYDQNMKEYQSHHQDSPQGDRYGLPPNQTTLSSPLDSRHRRMQSAHRLRGEGISVSRLPRLLNVSRTSLTGATMSVSFSTT
jgi:hypothetical protein